MVYYNENDPQTAEWLLKLIDAGVIASGAVDTRSIEDVSPDDLLDFDQCHFFAGIGGWSYALRLAEWPDDRPIWTGSCPCQPFSAAGKGGGFTDERHLWPAWQWLIKQCQPGIVVGEQVANALGWWDLVSGDMEGENYACGAVVVGAHSVKSPHIRQRLYWLANNDNTGSQRRVSAELSERAAECAVGAGSASDRVGDTSSQRRQQECGSTSRNEAANGRAGWDERQSNGDYVISRSSETDFWRDIDWLYCIDGKYRPTQPGLQPLAHGIPARVGRLRGYGNAIVPQVAAEFIKAFVERED